MSEPKLGPDTRIAVLGAGVEGRAVLQYLASLGCRAVTVCDKEESLDLPPEVNRQLGDGYLAGLDRFEVIFRSPGIPRDLASIFDAERAGAHITSATREFFRRCPCTIVGITGSNGKTTTTDLIAGLLRRLYGDTVHVGGNDRRPLLSDLGRIERDHVVVLELSSFQLADLPRSPHVAVVLNITPNHLDVHSSFEEYLAAKTQIVRHQTPADFAVLNWSFTRVRAIAEFTNAKVVYFNRVGADDGAFEREGRIVVRQAGAEEIVMSVADVPVNINLDNLLAAATVGRLFGVEGADVRAVVLGFPGVPHRLELVRELNGIRYFNDSASTTPESTANAIRAFAEGKVVLIAGGRDKGMSFDTLAKEIARTRTRAYFIGETRQRIAASVIEVGRRMKMNVTAEVCTSLAGALQAAREGAKAGDVIVLSPGCASFDMFRDAKDRGKQFEALVEALA